MLVYQDVRQSNHTSVWIDFEYDSALRQVTLIGRNLNLDEGSNWYFTRAGDRFDAQSIASQQFPLIIGFASNANIVANSVSFSPFVDFALGLEDGPDDFYLGVATGSAPWMGPREVYGWLKLRLIQPQFSAPRLEYLDSAMSYGQGIVIGTSVAVPEPSSCALSAGIFGLTLLAIRGRRVRSKRQPSTN
jgi:hypothetical protein